MRMFSYSVDVIGDVASRINMVLDEVAELDKGILDITDDDDYPLFNCIDEIRNQVVAICSELGIDEVV